MTIPHIQPKEGEVTRPLNQERRWWLKKFSHGGWTIGSPMKVGIAKWDNHTKALVKAGLLEDIGDGSMHRLTDAGRAELQTNCREAAP